MNNNGKILQEWLTPALLAAGLGMLLLIWGEVKDVRVEIRDVDTKLDAALLKLGAHQTVLEVYGLLPSAQASQTPNRRTPWTGP